MASFYGRCVFFVSDAARSLTFYTESLGFSLDWNHQEGDRPFVFQVSLFGFELILNQTEDWTESRAGHGRVFIGLDDDQASVFRRHIEEKRIATTTVPWGKPTLLIQDLDENELYFWLPGDDSDDSQP